MFLGTTTAEPLPFSQLSEKDQMKGLMTVAKHVAVVFKKDLNFTAEEVAVLPHDQRVPFLSNKLLAQEMPGEVGPGYINRFLNDYMNSEQLLASYQMKKYEGPVILFIGNETKEFQDESGGGWYAYAPNMRIITVTGHHDNIVFPPHAILLAKHMKEELLEPMPEEPPAPAQN